MLSLVRADGRSGPFQHSERGRQGSPFIGAFHRTETSLGRPKFPTAHKYDPGERPCRLCGWDVSRHGRGGSGTPSQAFAALPTLAALASPGSSRGQGTHSGAGCRGDRQGACFGLGFWLSPFPSPAPLYFSCEDTASGVKKWSGRHRTAHQLSDPKASSQVLLCSLR